MHSRQLARGWLQVSTGKAHPLSGRLQATTCATGEKKKIRSVCVLYLNELNKNDYNNIQFHNSHITSYNILLIISLAVIKVLMSELS